MIISLSLQKKVYTLNYKFIKYIPYKHRQTHNSGDNREKHAAPQFQPGKAPPPPIRRSLYLFYIVTGPRKIQFQLKTVATIITTPATITKTAKYFGCSVNSFPMRSNMSGSLFIAPPLPASITLFYVKGKPFEAITIWSFAIAARLSNYATGAYTIFI
jgi:hypothetical protein